MKTNWKTINNRLVKEFTFKDFNESLAFINKVGEIKIPYVDNTLKICKEDKEEILFKRDCKKGLDEFSFNKWDGSFKESKPCKILNVNQKALYK